MPSISNLIMADTFFIIFIYMQPEYMSRFFWVLRAVLDGLIQYPDLLFVHEGVEGSVLLLIPVNESLSLADYILPPSLCLQLFAFIHFRFLQGV